MASMPERLRALAESDTPEFERLMRQLDKIVLRPHPGQQLVLESPARFKVMNCGRRWGKTKLAAYIFTKKARKKDQMLWWVAPTYRVVKRGYEEVLSQLPPGVLTHTPPPATNFDAGRAVILRFKNGTKMEFYSAERPEGMLGAGVDYAIFDEAALMKSTIWDQIVGPTLMDRRGGALFISTPRGRNWFYKAWLLGQGREDGWGSWTFPSSTNPTLPPGEIERARKTSPKMYFEQEYEAKFLAAGSSVFLLEEQAFQRSDVLRSGLVDGYPVDGHYVVLGIDLARTNDYTVIYGARANDRRNVYFERFQDIAWHEQRRRIARAVRTLKRNGASGVTLIVDEGNAGDVIVEDLEIAGFDVVGINFTTHKANMVRLLANDLETGMAFVLEDEAYGRDEFDSYAMDVTPGGRYTYSAPDGDHDDVVSAKMLQHHGIVNEGVPEATILTPSEPTPSEARQTGDPDDEDGDAFGEWDDLIDEDFEDEVAAAREVGLRDGHDPPSADELLNSPDVWF